MAQNPTYNDGALVYGSAVITVTPKTGASPTRSVLTTFDCVMEGQFDFATNSKVVDQMDENGQYKGGFGIPEKRSGSGTAQLPALPTTRRIYAGDTFTVAITGNDFVTSGTTVFQVTNAGHPYEQDGYRKQPIDYFIRAFNVANNAANTPAAS